MVFEKNRFFTATLYSKVESKYSASDLAWRPSHRNSSKQLLSSPNSYYPQPNHRLAICHTPKLLIKSMDPFKYSSPGKFLKHPRPVHSSMFLPDCRTASWKRPGRTSPSKPPANRIVPALTGLSSAIPIPAEGETANELQGYRSWWVEGGR